MSRREQVTTQVTTPAKRERASKRAANKSVERIDG